MAMKITKPTEFADNITREYWRVGIANIHPLTNSCSVVLFGYVNKAARDGGKQPIGAPIEVSVPWSAFTNENNPNIRNIYDWLKAQPEWSASEEV